MTTLDLTTRLVTVPRHRDSLTHAIEKSRLDYVSAVVTCYEKGTGLTDDYEITGIPRVDDDVHRLTIELTEKELNAVQAALGRAANDTRLYVTGADRLELLHLRTLLAEAAAPPAPQPICAVHHMTTCGCEKEGG